MQGATRTSRNPGCLHWDVLRLEAALPDLQQDRLVRIECQCVDQAELDGGIQAGFFKAFAWIFR